MVSIKTIMLSVSLAAVSISAPAMAGPMPMAFPPTRAYTDCVVCPPETREGVVHMYRNILVASANDPWMRLTAASVWADRWGAQFECIGRAGHINADSGFGPWPQGLSLFERFRRAHGGHPLGSIERLHTRRFTSSDVANEGAFDDFTRRGERGLDQQWFG